MFLIFQCDGAGMHDRKTFRSKENIVAIAGINYHQSRWLGGWEHENIYSKAVTDVEDRAASAFPIVETI